MLDHMNNSRYFRELDLARIDFYLRTGLYDTIRKNHGHLVLGAANIRFRRFIRVFARFRITTKVIYWDDDSLYLEHRFIGANNVIHAILLCQQKMIKCSGENVMNELLKKGTTMLPKPEMPIEVNLLNYKNSNKNYFSFFRFRSFLNFKKSREKCSIVPSSHDHMFCKHFQLACVKNHMISTKKLMLQTETFTFLFNQSLLNLGPFTNAFH